MKTSERLRRWLRHPNTPTALKADLRKSVDEIERIELQEHARILAAAAGPQAAKEPPWAQYLRASHAD